MAAEVFAINGEEASAILARHNLRIGGFLDNWYRHSGVSWTPGMVVPPDVRWALDGFVPWQEVRQSLAALGRAVLPSYDWLPRLLWKDGVDSLIGFWEELPEYAGRLRLKAEELPQFFCACADPPRYGTASGRYPAQLEMLAQLCGANGRLLDLGCGIGLGTLEAAKMLRCRSALGITLEPLEAWMANRRWLPHDAARSEQFADYVDVNAVEFQVGDAAGFVCDEKFDVIVCNGLAGGRFLDTDDDMRNFIANCLTMLAADGILAIANSFHSGRQAAVVRLTQIAAQCHLEAIVDYWHNLVWRRR